MNTDDFLYLLGMAGTVAFAVTAVLAVIPKGIDLLGASVMGIITSVGGGTIRDVILDVPVFWSTDLNYIWVALVSSIIAFYGNRFMARKNIYSLMLYLDAVGVSMFVIQGAEKTIEHNFGMPIGPVVLGVITAIGGGLIRDVLSDSTTLLLKKDIYAVPLTVGAVLYTLLIDWLPEHATIISGGCSLLIFFIRASAIYWQLQVPQWMLIRGKKGDL